MQGGFGIKIRFSFVMFDSCGGSAGNVFPFSFAVNNFKPEIIFHLAAQPLVRESYKIPLETIETNVTGTANVLEAFRMSESAKILIVVTSDKCYDNKEQLCGYKETDPMGGYDPYSASKGAAELISSAYLRSFFNPEYILGFSNILEARSR